MRSAAPPFLHEALRNLGAWRLRLATRRKLDPLDEPDYDVGSVPRCVRGADGLPDPKASFVVRAGSTEEERSRWVRAIPEFLLLCNAAAKEAKARVRSVAKRGAGGVLSVPRSKSVAGQFKESDGSSSSAGTSVAGASSTPIPTPAPLPEQFGGKPLAIEYVADRLDVDDPMYGYVVRQRGTGHIQGFITLTTFTTWCRFFRW